MSFVDPLGLEDGDSIYNSKGFVVGYTNSTDGTNYLLDLRMTVGPATMMQIHEISDYELADIRYKAYLAWRQGTSSLGYLGWPGGQMSGVATKQLYYHVNNRNSNLATQNSGYNSKLVGKSANEKGVTVYVENDGIGHVYLKVNGTVFSYGRYDGSYSPYSGAFGPIGNGVLLKRNSSYVKLRMAKYSTSEYSFPSANANKIYRHLNGMYNSGTPAKNGGRIVDTYFLIGNNCATVTSQALRIGGVDMPIIQTPVGFNSYMILKNWFKFQ